MIEAATLCDRGHNQVALRCRCACGREPLNPHTRLRLYPHPEPNPITSSLQPGAPPHPHPHAELTGEAIKALNNELTADGRGLMDLAPDLATKEVLSKFSRATKTEL